MLCVKIVVGLGLTPHLATQADTVLGASGHILKHLFPFLTAIRNYLPEFAFLNTFSHFSFLSKVSAKVKIKVCQKAYLNFYLVEISVYFSGSLF